MLSNAQIAGLVLFVLAAIATVIFVAPRERVRADDQQEVKPYAFAELPHGRIYKVVHEGCEIFIAEGEMRVSGAPDSGHFYTVATGRGCK